MAWTELKAQTWQAELMEAIGRLDAPAGPGIARFEHVRDPNDRAMIHRGDLRVEGDFKPPTVLTLILGDLDVTGQVSTQEVDGADGNATLVVIGNLTCSSLVNDWASLVLVSGNIVARYWVFAAREDSSMVAGGDFTTPVFIGEDIWVAVGGAAHMESGLGYAAPMVSNRVEDTSRAIRPKVDEATTAKALGLGDDEFEWTETLEKRLHETGTIFPAE